MARLDAGCDMPERAPVDLGASMAAVCQQVAQLAQSHGLEMHVAVGADSVCVFAAEDHLRRLWMTLLENAIRYTPPGGRIAVTVQRSEDGNVRCSVQDSGIGIEVEHLPRIFERFYRVDKARARASGGCGLGLSIAAELAHLYGATIEVMSVPGTGSNFTVIFPVTSLCPTPEFIESQLILG